MNNHVTVYTPESPLRHPTAFARQMVDDLWASRQLAWRLFVRDVTAQYRNSALGYLWILVPPLVAGVPFVYLNAVGVVSMGETPIPYGAYALVGTIIWQTFVDALNSPLRSANAARSILTRIRFPREAILLSGLMQVGVSFLGRVALLVTVFLIFALEPAPTAPLFLLGILSVAMTGFMIGLIVTPIGLLYGDVSHALPIATTFLMLLTPVLYPPPSTGVAAMIAAVNPLTPLITTTRDWLTVGTAPEAGSFAVITLVTATFLMLGWIVYRVALPHLIARLGN